MPKTRQLKALAKEAAMERASMVVDKAWPKMWKKREEALHEHCAQNKDPNAFSYGFGIAVTLDSKGSGEIEVSTKASWSVKETASAKPTLVSEHPELFDKPEEKKGEKK